MTITDAVTLGLVQGFTEFLPISSSGHLVIGQHLLHFKGPNIAFDIVLHLGTLLAVLVYFRQDLGKILYSFSAQGDRQWRRVALLVLLGTVPTGLIGFFFKDPLEALFSSVRLVALMLCVTGFLLFLADRVARTDRPLAGMGWKDALLIGVVQGLAIIPGISRSGSTISTGLYLKIEGEAAARFSFLLSIPAILGAVVLEGKDILGGISNGSGEAFFMGFITSALSGLLAIKILMEVVKKKRLTFFSIYCWLVAGTVFFLMV